MKQKRRRIKSNKLIINLKKLVPQLLSSHLGLLGTGRKCQMVNYRMKGLRKGNDAAIISFHINIYEFIVYFTIIWYKSFAFIIFGRILGIRIHHIVISWYLFLYKSFINSILLDKLHMFSFLDNFTIFHNSNPIAIYYCGKSVCNNYHCVRMSVYKIINSLLNQTFTLGIKGWCSFIEYQNFRLFNHTSSNCNTLLLPTWKLDSSLTD